MTPEPLGTVSCGHCGGPMARVHCGVVVLDRCDHCGALWFDGGELETVLERPETLPAHTPKASAGARATDALILCPRCPGLALEAVRRGAVGVHRCPRCHGVLVGRSAIEAILSASRDGSGPGVNVDLDFGGGSGSDENVVGAVLNFIGDLLLPPG